MLSFVVQNFNRPNPFLLKTVRLNEYTVLFSSHALTTLLKSTLYLLNFSVLNDPRVSKLQHFLTVFFWNNFWSYFYLSTKRFIYTYSNTLYLSILYWKSKLLFNSPAISNTANILKRLSKGRPYLKPVPVLYFSFHKVKYNTFIIFLLKLLTDYYYTFKTNFSIQYSFLFYTTNYSAYNFVNKYYFKVRHY